MDFVDGDNSFRYLVFNLYQNFFSSNMRHPKKQFYLSLLGPTFYSDENKNKQVVPN